MPTRAYHTIWFVLVYAWIANYLVRMALAALLGPIMTELRLSYTEAGFLSTAFFYAYLAMQLPAGMLGDRFGRRRLLLVGIVLGAVASALTGLAGSFLSLFLARLLTGLSQGFLFSNDRALINATTPPEKMALGQGVSFSGAGLGTTLGLLLAGTLGVVLAWRSVFLLFALPPLVAAVLLWRLVPEPPRAARGSAPVGAVRRILGSRDFWLLGMSGIMPISVQFILASWGPLLFVEIGVNDLGRSASLASLQGVVAPAGLLLSGLLADRLHGRGVGRKVVIAAALVLVGGSTIGMGAVIGAQGPAWLLTLLLLASSFSVWCTWGPAYAIVGELFPAAMLGKAFGLSNTVWFVGAVLGPLVTGRIKDVTGSFAAGLVLAGALAALSALAILALRPAFRHEAR